MITQLAGDNAVLFGSIGQVETINILRLDSAIGGKVSIALPEKHHPPQPRPLPVLLPPRQFPLLIGRRQEAKVAIAALPYDQPVEFYGSSGIGKTVLLRYLAHHPSITPAFPDGIVYHHLGRYQSVSDLLQILFDAYYENSTPFKHTDFQIRDALKDKKALILLDEAKLTREEVQSLINNLPSFTFLFTSQERQLWGEGHPVELCGLPLNDAISLVARDLGRSLSVEERTEAEVLCSTLNGHPLQILQALALVREENLSLAAVAKQIKASTSPSAWTEQLLSSLKKPQKFVLALLAALGANVALGAERIADITQLSEVKPIIETLLRRNLVQSNGSGYSITSNLTKELQEQGDITPWMERTVNYFTNWVQQHQGTPKLLWEEADAILRVLEWTVGSGRWFDVLCLGRAVEGVLALSGQWDTWNLVLQWILQAARAIGDQAAEAFALHQLATRALCLNETVIAHDYLTQSLHLRESLSDQLGIEVTRHNLNFLLNLPLPTQNDPQPSPSPSPPKLSISPLLKGGVLAFLLLPLGVLLLKPTSNPSASPTDSSTPTSPTPSATDSSTPTSNPTPSATFPSTPTSPTPSATDSSTPTSNPTPSATFPSTPTPTPTPSATVPSTPTPTPTPSATVPSTPTPTPTSSATVPSTPTPTPSASLSPPEKLEFSAQEVGNSSEVQIITLTNKGSGTLTIGKVTVTGRLSRFNPTSRLSRFNPTSVNTDEFTITDNRCSQSSIAPERSCNISISFKPKEPGRRSASLSIEDNAANSPHQVFLSGTGVKSLPIVSLPRELEFPNRHNIGGVADISKMRTITLTNKGSGILKIEEVAITGYYKDQFIIYEDKCSLSFIAPNNNCTIRISSNFTGRVPRGAIEAILSIKNNAADSPHEVSLRETKPPTLKIIPSGRTPKSNGTKLR